ncbi:TonB-dependent receptor plug domain-containing protein [Collimonas arenae]|uniref:TonB-dependent receptor plug domain-containing protein n=1 Tax=Collimonas arenae TaxID=279058 RepID=UPI000B1F70B1|nr:TonB-dependent receptor plug domain-containing protein [Collimonas arenae]
MKRPSLKPGTQQILHALAVMCMAAPMIASAQQATDLGAVSASGGSGATDNSSAPVTATKTAPVQGSLTARSAQSIVSDQFIRDLTSPVADFSQVLQMTPGMYSYSPNGVGLGDTKTYFRGFSDGDYTVSFDGIPFQDTNSPSHHTWAFFPSQFLGGAVVDRSPARPPPSAQPTLAARSTCCRATWSRSSASVPLTHTVLSIPRSTALNSKAGSSAPTVLPTCCSMRTR